VKNAVEAVLSIVFQRADIEVIPKAKAANQGRTKCPLVRRRNPITAQN
jgi:hypothetical protein